MNREKLLNVVGLAALVFLIVVRWPMLKGLYYSWTTPKNAEIQSAVEWREAWPQAVIESKLSGKPILLDFNAPWCPPCQLMKHEVWTDPTVGDAVNDKTIPVEINIDLAENQELARKYQVETIPALILVDAEGRVLGRAGFMPGDQVLSFLKFFDGIPRG